MHVRLRQQPCAGRRQLLSSSGGILFHQRQEDKSCGECRVSSKTRHLSFNSYECGIFQMQHPRPLKHLYRLYGIELQHNEFEIYASIIYISESQLHGSLSKLRAVSPLGEHGHNPQDRETSMLHSTTVLHNPLKKHREATENHRPGRFKGKDSS